MPTQSLIGVSPWFLALIIALDFGLLAAFFLWGSQFFKRLFRSRDEAAKRMERAEKEAEEILAQARAESLKVIGKAHATSAEILKQSQVSREEFQKEFSGVIREFSRGETERLLKVSEGFLKVYQTSMDEARKTYMKTIDSLHQHLAERARDGTTELDKYLAEEVARFETTARQHFESLQTTVSQEVEDYKKEMIKRVERSIYRIIYLVSTNVLGKSIDLEAHQDLVIRALDEAKKEGFFE